MWFYLYSSLLMWFWFFLEALLTVHWGCFACRLLIQWCHFLPSLLMATALPLETIPLPQHSRADFPGKWEPCFHQGAGFCVMLAQAIVRCLPYALPVIFLLFIWLSFEVALNWQWDTLYFQQRHNSTIKIVFTWKLFPSLLFSTKLISFGLKLLLLALVKCKQLFFPF